MSFAAACLNCLPSAGLLLNSSCSGYPAPPPPVLPPPSTLGLSISIVVRAQSLFLSRQSHSPVTLLLGHVLGLRPADSAGRVQGEGARKAEELSADHAGRSIHHAIPHSGHGGRLSSFSPVRCSSRVISCSHELFVFPRTRRTWICSTMRRPCPLFERWFWSVSHTMATARCPATCVAHEASLLAAPTEPQRRFFQGCTL
jgi:hypothetical protein